MISTTFKRDLSRSKQDGRVGRFGQRYCLRLRINEFLAPIFAGIEPGAQRFRLAGRSFAKCDHHFVRRLEAIVRNGQDRRADGRFVFVEDLDNVAVGLRIQHRQNT